MTTPVGLHQFPNSDADGRPFPFDIGDPYGLVIESVAVAASASLSLSADVVSLVGLFFCTVRTVVSFNGTAPVLTERLLSTEQIIIGANKEHRILMPDYRIRCMSADGSSVGKLYLQLYRPWKAGGVGALAQRN